MKLRAFYPAPRYVSATEEELVRRALRQSPSPDIVFV
jgi:hypothetical protein